LLVNVKEKGQFMITQLLKQKVASDKGVAHCSLVAILVMVLGIRRLAVLDLNEAQLYSAMTSTMIFSSVFIILAFQCRACRRAA
jgi:hypothetical protein